MRSAAGKTTVPMSLPSATSPGGWAKPRCRSSRAARTWGQTATREAIEQYRSLIREFPDSGYAGAARERVRQLTDLLAEHDFGIGYFYLRKGSTAAALSRLDGKGK